MSEHAPGASSEDILKLVQAVNPWALSQLEVRSIVNRCRACGHSPEVRVAFAGNVVLDPLPDYMRVHLAHGSIRASAYGVPMGQLMAELDDPGSGLRQFDAQVLYLHFEVEELLHGALDRRAFETPQHRRAACRDIVDFVVSLTEAALNRTKATIVLDNFVSPCTFALGLADFRSEFGEQEFYLELNLSLARLMRANPRVQILDLAGLTAHYGRGRVRDRRLYHVSRIPWQDGFFSPLADCLARHVKVALGRGRKCLVVDLDNTLWQGVLGEDGAQGVRVGIGDPEGESHLNLQRKILELKQRGIILAVCSKNNPEDVQDFFRLRPDVPLRLDDFSAMEIGWNPKHEGLQRIARSLNISTNSLVFLDDQEAEIALIHQLLPEVECVLVPASSNLRATCLDSLHSLDRAVVTSEDVAKRRQYADDAVRKTFKASFSDLREYLQSLQTSITISRANHELLARAHQLFTKTNQFNVTGRRYTPGELEQAACDPSACLLMVHARDQFGDMGWISAVLLRADGPNCHIENFVLSCRALGRSMEICVLEHVRQRVFDQARFELLTAEYRPGPKNSQVSTLFESQGFDTTDAGDDGVKRYALPRGRSLRTGCDWISVRTEDSAWGTALEPRQQARLGATASR